MSEKSNITIRLSKAAKEFNIGKDAIVEFLAKKGFQIDSAPNTKLTADMYGLLAKEFQGEKEVKEEAKRLGNLSYKGGSVSVDSAIKTQKDIIDNRIKEKTNTISKKKRKEQKVVEIVERKEEIKEKSQENIEQTKIEYNATFSELKFEQGYISLIYDKKYCIYRDYRIRDYGKTLEQIFGKLSKKGKEAIQASIIKVVIDIETETFVFKDIDILIFVNRLKDIYLPENNSGETSNKNVERKNEQNESGNENEEKEKTNKLFKTKIERKVLFNTIRFGHGFASITYKRRNYYYKDPKIRNFDKTIKQIFSRLSKARRHSLNTFFIEVIIDIPAGTFTFKNVDICEYVNELKESSLPENNKTENRNRIRLNKAARMFNVSKDAIVGFLAKNGFIIVNPQPNTKLSEEMYKLLVKEYQGGMDVPQKPPTIYEKMSLGTGNIQFFNGYYLIFQTTNGKVDNSVTPYRVNDPNSLEILNLVHSYFERKLEQLNIIVKIDKTAILEPSKIDQFQLSNYVRFLNQNLNEKGGWWEEVQNYRKPSLKQCRSVSAEVAKKKVSLKNGYLDSLVSMQSEIKLIPVYEVNLNHGKEEDAFIFTINMSNDRCAVIFENASNDASTTTWVFVTKKENYEPCINLVFDYFTDYTIAKKRLTLRNKTVNLPKKFKAESYTFIDHDDLGQWLKKLNKILEQSSEPSDIAFVPGLHIPESSESRTGHDDTITTKHLHNQLMRKLYDRLCIEHGKDNVGTEIRTGTKRIDCVVKGDDHYDIYEIKTAENPFDCVTEALGQLCRYTYLYCRDKIGKMVIVGASETNKEVEQYLSWFRKNYSLQLFYMKV
ncbi:MAG: hypothetical protein IKS53_07490 [Bacteroidales bacterium]|nr:hypothetical protein [Bacteroidales bacterium]